MLPTSAEACKRGGVKIVACEIVWSLVKKTSEKCFFRKFFFDPLYQKILVNRVVPAQNLAGKCLHTFFTEIFSYPYVYTYIYISTSIFSLKKKRWRVRGSRN